MCSDGGNVYMNDNEDVVVVRECRCEIRKKPSTNQGLEGRTWQSGADSMGGGPQHRRDHRLCCISRMG